jgi:hypothetical protein
MDTPIDLGISDGKSRLVGKNAFPKETHMNKFIIIAISNPGSFSNAVKYQVGLYDDFVF